MVFVQLPIELATQQYSANTYVYINVEEVSKITYNNVIGFGSIVLMSGEEVKISPSYTTFWSDLFSMLNLPIPT